MKIILLSVLCYLPFMAFAQNYPTDMTVASDGSADFTHIQQAIDATKSFPNERISIHIKDGVYKEKINIYSWNTKVTLIGQSREGTIITFNDNFNKIDKGRNSTFHTYTMRVAGNDFIAQNLTITNSSGSDKHQAIALHIEADRAAFENVTIRGFQDTLYVAGENHRSYFKNCYIEGSVDFIFGEGTALFESCEIKSLLNGYITAASTPKDSAFGLVFKQCRITAEESVDQVFLGRPWRKYAHSVFMDSQIDKHIQPEGWHNWGNPDNEKSAYYAEYGNTGPGASLSNRVKWSKQLNKKIARKYSPENILRGWRPLQ